MFFLLKSIFWLSLVFYCMSWPGGERPEAIASRAAGDAAMRARTALVDSAVAACSADPTRCLAMARAGAATRDGGARPGVRSARVD